MQTRHQDRSAYFEETATSCRNYYLPYIEQHTSLKFGRNCRVMEVGCGFGGILSIFAAKGATVTGIDIHKPSIETAKTLFAERGLKGTFICSDIFDYSDTQPYDLIILHDALEHIPEKERLMLHLKSFLKADGLFCIWDSPHGKCRSGDISKWRRTGLSPIVLTSTCCPDLFSVSCSGHAAKRKVL